MTNNETQGESALQPDQSSRPLGATLSTLVGTLVGTACFLAGYLLVVGNQESFGSVMFVLVPSMVGFAIALVTRGTTALAACCFTTIILSLALLIIFGFEG